MRLWVVECLVPFVCLLTYFQEFLLLALLHRRRELEFCKDVLFKQQDNFTDRCLKNGVSRGPIQAQKRVSATFRCGQRFGGREDSVL